jgi:asparagine synthase (glutamine-hydrolysing)
LQNSEFDEFGIRQYRKLRMTIRGYTLYKDIKLFPPGHYMLNGELNRYWDLSCQAKEPPDDDELRWLIEDAVRLRKRSDVSVGSYLSGGLDSSVLTAILQPQNTWTVGFRELNEFDWSDLANRDLNTIHHKTIVDKETFLKTTQWMINKRREPLSVPNEVLIYHMTQSVKKENTVVLSGEGADELFWGYDRIFRWAYQANVMKINEFDEKYCYGTHKDDEVLDFALEGIPGKTVLDKVGYYFQIHHLQGLLRRLDNSTMLCSVEARVPFVDHRLVELLDGVPFEWRMGSTFKEPLKRIFHDLIPQEIIERKKIGFPVPLESIFPDYSRDKTAMDSWLNFNLNKIVE